MGWHHLLLPLTPLYAAAVRARASAYSRGWLKVHQLPVPVISVGNLSFGGTGKTPAVISLVRDLVRRGRKPAVLSRGYGRRVDLPVVAIGPEPEIDAATAGDEPVEMARALPGVPIVVDADRVRGGETAIELGADLLLLDDGFQHLRLARNLNLALLDAGDPWGGGKLPPLGRLREPVDALKRASAVLITKLYGSKDPRFAAIRERVHAVVDELPVLGVTLTAHSVRTMDGRHSADLLRFAKVFAFAGIGRPEGFVELLEATDAEVVGQRFFPDHHIYTADDLREIFQAAGELGVMPVTTAKDAAKLPKDLELWVVDARMEPLTGSWTELWSLVPEVLG